MGGGGGGGARYNDFKTYTCTMTVSGAILLSAYLKNNKETSASCTRAIVSHGVVRKSKCGGAGAADERRTQVI